MVEHNVHTHGLHQLVEGFCGKALEEGIGCPLGSGTVDDLIALQIGIHHSFHGTDIVLTDGTEYTYTGQEIKPHVTVMVDRTVLVEQEHYTVTYSNNIGVGTGTVTVTGIEDKGTHKTVLTEDGNTYEAKAVIIAAGARHRHLGLPHEDIHIGEGISFCAVCDGAFYAGREIAVIGGGNSALQEAVMLSDICQKVTVIQNLGVLTGEKRLADKLKSVLSISADVRLMEPGSIERSQGKSKRVIDNRKL